jgi:DNA-binding response OmpR family regulator
MLTAIVIDDYEESADLLEYHLKLFGINVVAKGSNGMEAALLYRELRPNVVFLDLSMPAYDGFYGLTKIKQFNPAAKVIITTADTSLETKHRLAILGATDILYKPLDEKEMRHVIKTYNDVHAINLNFV